jgi:chemotaxis family two-component system response regulator PixH
MKRILLIEGNTNIRRFIKRELTKGGYSVVEAADGLEALIRLKEDKPEILIVDVHTKKKKALETFREAATAARALPAIILKSKTPYETDVSNWNPASILDRSCKTPELLKAIESLRPAKQAEKKNVPTDVTAES